MRRPAMVWHLTLCLASIAIRLLFIFVVFKITSTWVEASWVTLRGYFAFRVNTHTHRERGIASLCLEMIPPAARLVAIVVTVIKKTFITTTNLRWWWALPWRLSGLLASSPATNSWKLSSSAIQRRTSKSVGRSCMQVLFTFPCLTYYLPSFHISGYAGGHGLSIWSDLLQYADQTDFCLL